MGEPCRLADFLPDEAVDEFGYVWKKIETDHTIELIGFDGDVEMGGFIVSSDDSEEARQINEQTQWIVDRANILYPDGFSINVLKEVIRHEHENN